MFILYTPKSMAEISINETQFVDTEDPSRDSFEIEARLKYVEKKESTGSNTLREIIMQHSSTVSMIEARQELADSWDQEIVGPARTLAILLPEPTPPE